MEFKIYDTLPQEAREIRLRVFVREQGFQEEFDTADKFSTHIVAYDGDIPIATCRYYTQDSRFLIGRIAVIKQYRGKGIGANMLAFAMEKIRKVGGKEIRIHAQRRAEDFYKKQGFEAFGEVDFDEGCEHVWMKRVLG